MAEQTPGRTGSADETTGTGGTAGGGETPAAAGGTGAGSGAGGGGTGAPRGSRRGAAAGAEATEGQTGGTTRSRSRKTAASGAAGTQAAEGGTTRSRSRKSTTEAGDTQGTQTGGTRGGGARTAGGSTTGRGKKSAQTQASGPDLRSDLRQFVSSRPQGWSHDDWTGLLGSLRERGHDVSDSEQIGRQLEQERLSHRLEQVQGLKPQQVRALSEHFRTLWSLRQASVDQIAQVQNINRETAQRVHEQLR